MKEFLRYYKTLLLLPIALFLSYSSTAQVGKTLEFKIQLHEPDEDTGENSWGVYVRPQSGFADNNNGTVTASGQVTILMDLAQAGIRNIESVNGNWNTAYDSVMGPMEASTTAYYFVGLDDEGDGIELEDGMETLLFTFQTAIDCPDRLELIDNDNDAFNVLPNSADNNPGMDLAVFNTNTGSIYNWGANYAPRSFSCDDSCDMDGIPDGLEDTNGNGVYDPPIMVGGVLVKVDSSDLCDACDPLGISNFSATLDGGDLLSVCSGGSLDSAALNVSMTGGEAPYTVYLGLDSGDPIVHTTQSINVAASGDTFYVRPTVTTTYTLDSIVDALGCALTDMDSLMGQAVVTVEGPLSWDGANGNQPADVTSCTLDTIFFDVDALNGGDGDIQYQWQVSSDDVNYTNIVNGTPYSLADTDSLVISNPDGLNGNYYRALVFTETCDTLTSLSAQLQVEGPFVVNTSPMDATICGEDTHVMVASTENQGSGTIERLWQVNDQSGAGWSDLTDDATYSGATTDMLTINSSKSNISALNEHWYRLKIGGAGGFCTDIFTDSARLVVEGPIVIAAGNEPKDTTTCEGEVACFGVLVDNPGGGTLEYQWYMANTVDPPTWVALSNDGNFSGVRSDTMCIADAAGLDGHRFEVRVNTGECSAIESSNSAAGPATLTVSDAISFSAHPQGEAVCSGEQVIFSTTIVSADPGLTTKWQVSSDTGQTWIDATGTLYSGETTTTLTVNTGSSTQPDTLDGLLYRVAVDGDFCNEVFSLPAELNVHSIDATAITQPRDTTVCSGEPAYFEIGVPYNRNEEELRYRWQIQNPTNSQWVNLNPVGDYNGVNTKRLSISDVNGFNGMIFRVGVFTQECDTIFSNTATLTVEGPYVFGADDDGHPQDTTVCAGEPVTFSANPVIDMTTTDHFGNVNEGESSTLTYAWVFNALGEYNNPDSVYKLPTAVSGEATTELTINDPSALNGYAFWLEVRSAECAIPTRSLPAILNIDGPLSVTTEPVNAENCSDQGAIFGAVITNPGFGRQRTIDYQWREKDAATGIWRDLTNTEPYNGANTDTLSIDVLYGLDGNEYALLATIDGCSVVSTDTVSLKEEGPITVTRDPVDIITCAGQSGYFAADVIDSTGNSTLQHIWQVSTNNGLDWSNLSDATPYSTVTTDSMNISDVTGLHGYRYRLATTNASGSCDTVFSQAARITAEGPIIFEALDPNQEACSNIGITIDAKIDISAGATGPGVPSLQWQISTDGGSNFTDLANAGIYDAVTSNKLFIDSVLNIDTYQYRLAGTTEQCELAGEYFYSDTVTVTTVSDTTANCDFDLDGLLNGDNYNDPGNPLFDHDDDNDGLMDSIEIYISTYGDPEDSVSIFNTDTDNDGINDSEEDADEDTINNGEETDDDDADGDADDVDVFTGDPLDPCEPILSPACIGVVLDIRVKLQGAMLGTAQAAGTLMRDDLRTKGLLPDQEKYTNMYVKKRGNVTQELAFVHVDDHQVDPNKGGNEIMDSSLKADQANPANDIVDWVFIELRSGIQLDSIIATRAALLQRDGDVRDIDPQDPSAPYTDADGYRYLRFDSTLAGEYYVSVRHRNHLGVMTNEAGVLSPKVTTIDFTDATLNVLGVHPQKMVVNETLDTNGDVVSRDSVEQYMWAGDLNSDRKVIYQGAQNDVDEMFFNVIRELNNSDLLDNYILPGYLRSDYNLDGNTIYQGPNNDRQMLIFNTILSFPDNQEKFLANYVVLEQLP